MDFSSFKAYDIRGVYQENFDESLAADVARAMATFLHANAIVIGHDIRSSSPSIHKAMKDALNNMGVNTYDIGLCGSEMVYFASSNLEVEGGIMITASHNPKNYNGLKLVRKNAVPIGSDSGLQEIKEIINSKKNLKNACEILGKNEQVDISSTYINHLMSYSDLEKLAPLKIVTNAGNGCAGPYLDMLETKLPFEFIKLNNLPDADFPNDVPNPMLIEQQKIVGSAVIENNADFGIAWDGDFDRCFFFDENGRFIDGYYLVGLLAEHFIKDNPGERIVYEPRVVWNTEEIIDQYQGKPILSKSGHAFIKRKMKEENAIFGGEMSGHYYFRNFSYADSGMIPWIIIAEILSVSGKSFSQLINNRIESFPASGEINFKVRDTAKVITELKNQYKDANQINEIDGISMEFEDWRFNVRASNTEPLLRLNIETKNNTQLVTAKVEELSHFIVSV